MEKSNRICIIFNPQSQRLVMGTKHELRHQNLNIAALFYTPGG